MKRRFTLKKKVYLIFLVAVIVNSIFLGLCYKFYVIPRIENTGDLIEVSVVEDLKEINIEELDTKLNELSKKHKVEIKIIDNNGNILFNNIDDVGEARYLLSEKVFIDDNTYYVTIVKRNTLSVGSTIRNLLIFQMGMLFLIGLFGSLLTNHTFWTPLEETVEDMDDYKLGKKPKKRKVVTQIDYIQNEFVDLVNDLEEEKRVQNNIISSISHDIKTPLTSIIGYTQLLKVDEISRDDKNKYVDKIYKKALLMKDIVNDFDDYLITNSKRAFRYKSIDLEEFMNYINNDYEDDLKEEGISLEIINNCSSLALNMDVSKIRRVFSNIISNSVRYLRDDGKIIINCNDLGDYIEFVIEDNGKWVPEENLVKIFEPLYTTDPSRKISGLGLSICKDIIEAHNGTIRAYNNKLGGLSIEFTISKNIRNEELHK
jgi:signal transduction histidine kinase